MARQIAHERHNHSGDDDWNEQGQDALLTEEAEGHARIPYIDEGEEGREDLESCLGLVIRGLNDQNFRDLIGSQHDDAGQPGNQRGNYRMFWRDARPARCCANSCSAFALSSMQRVEKGRASSRGRGICLPHRSHFP